MDEGNPMKPDPERIDALSSDSELVGSARAGDEGAAAELYRRYAARLRRMVAARCGSEFAARFDPDDVVQSVFLALHEGLRAKFYDVPQGGELWGLLFVLALNKVRDRLSFHRAARRSVHRTLPEGDAGDLIGDDEADAAALRLEVEEYLAGLPEPDRSIVSLRMSGHTVDEVSAQVGRAKRTVERILQQSRDQLAALLRP
jgi:RNA polymerase sigma-70 factor (ECF subfamily)